MTALFSAENHKIGALAESRVAYANYSHIQKSRVAYALMHQFFTRSDKNWCKR